MIPLLIIALIPSTTLGVYVLITIIRDKLRYTRMRERQVAERLGTNRLRMGLSRIGGA